MISSIFISLVAAGSSINPLLSTNPFLKEKIRIAIDTLIHAPMLPLLLKLKPNTYLDKYILYLSLLLLVLILIIL